MKHFFKNASELLESNEEMFPWYHRHSDMLMMFKILTTYMSYLQRKS